MKKQRGLYHVDGLAFLVFSSLIFGSIAAPGIIRIFDTMDEGNSFKEAFYMHLSEKSYLFLAVEGFATLLLVFALLIFLYPIYIYSEWINGNKNYLKQRWSDCENAWMAFYNHEYPVAYERFKPLAEQGNSSAQCGLGLMYQDGWFVQEDHEKAVKWFRLSAYQGDSRGQHLFGIMYENGYGVEQDYKEAAKWHSLAAEQGDTEAQYSIGKMYMMGHGVDQDYVLAYKWLYLSAINGGETDIEGNFDFLSTKMTLTQINEAKKLAQESMEDSSSKSIL